MSHADMQTISISMNNSDIPPYFRPQPSLDRQSSNFGIVLMLLISTVLSAIALVKFR